MKNCCNRAQVFSSGFIQCLDSSKNYAIHFIKKSTQFILSSIKDSSKTTL